VPTPGNVDWKIATTQMTIHSVERKKRRGVHAGVEMRKKRPSFRACQLFYQQT
jgi:hypothetical protein